MKDQANSYALNNLDEVKISSDKVRLTFSLTEDPEFINLNPFVELGRHIIPLSKTEFRPYCIISDSTIYLINDPSDINTFNYLKGTGKVKVKKENIEGFFKSFIIPLSEKYPLQNNTSIKMKDVQGTALPKLYLKELDNFLLLIPTFEYRHGVESKEVEIKSGLQIILDTDEGIVNVKRDIEKEEEVVEYLRSFIPRFHPSLTILTFI